MRINIWIPDEDLELIDRARGEKSRSAFLVGAARKVISTKVKTKGKKVVFKRFSEQIADSMPQGEPKKGKWVYSKILGKKVWVEE